MPLDPEIAAYLEAQKSLPPRSGLTLEQTRARMVESAKLYGGATRGVASMTMLLLGNNLQVREYSADGERPEIPLMLYFHGGRFISGNLLSHDPLCRHLAMGTHYRVVAVDYRLAPEHPFPAALDDASRALDWALSQSLYDRIVVAGDSAGANIAAVLAAQRRQDIRGQVLIYPMIDATRSLPSHVEFGEGFGPSTLDMKRGWDEYLPAGADPKDPRISPLFSRNLEQLPPALVITAEYDCLRDEGEQYAHNMGLAGNHVELKRCLGAIHGFITLTGVSRLARETISDIGGYLGR
jgi:acetyl esterase